MYLFSVYLGVSRASGGVVMLKSFIEKFSGVKGNFALACPSKGYHN